MADRIAPEWIDADTSLDEARRRAARRLAPVSGVEASLDARFLVEEATGLGRTLLRDAATRALGAVAAKRLNGWLARRLGGEPLWRVLGQREFWGLRFAVTPAVLDPRPDTETLVSAVLEQLGSRRDGSLRLLDLGVGSGAILCALLSELPHARGVGLDRSEAACRVARHNAAALALGSRTLVVNGTWAEALAGGFDVVVSNPPYIETDAIATLAPEVRDHDPLVALDGGPDGLACYRAIVTDLPRLLAPGGLAALEVGATQALVVGGILATAGLTPLGTRRDLGGHERVVLARRP